MRALISVSDKTGIIDFAKGLAELGVEIVSTGGTYQLLTQAGISAVPVETLTGFPEMLDGRVKTLHPKVHGGILARRDLAGHRSMCAEHDIGFIDLVVVNLYPFETTVAKGDATLEEAIENIDIGGPAMIRSAAKNMDFVTVVVSPARYEAVLAELKARGATSLPMRKNLAQEAFLHTSRYDAIIATYLARQFQPHASPLQSHLVLALDRAEVLRYGENPHQQAALYHTNLEGRFSRFRQLHGKALSFNNLIDAQAAWNIVSELSVPAAAVIKHTNPCGAAIGTALAEAYQRAYDADPLSAFGSIVGLNRKVDLSTAQKLSDTFVEVIVAPGYEPDALSLLSKKSALRLLEIPASDSRATLDIRFLDGVCLVQEQDHVRVLRDRFEVVTNTRPTSPQLVDLELAFQLVKHVKSNAIVLVKEGQLIGTGAGQMSRVDAVRIALEKAGAKAEGAVAASDAFFPFKDGVELLVAAGVKAIVQPGGSKRDAESIDVCNATQVAMVYTGIRHFKH